ncbi:hypothetical protein [uncultured Sulfitobacter sp.]|uniref:hypothetical protein n=1 Tax=uncultured Sulfitobacter sp. TaxID=191468 RepID=UPI002627906B|nr:hypothetical protein [uncultured Sulfitobacter sp.]
MTALILRWISVAALGAGALLLTFSNMGPWAGVFESHAQLMIPIAYFAMILGAVGLSIGWFLKQR